LTRWLFFANRGEFPLRRLRGDHEQGQLSEPLSNAVLVWNTMAITKIIIRLRAAGEAIADEDLARI
jgi:TnpA family transposase